MTRQPWASGPGEILRHGLSLLQQDNDTNRRLAMLSIDNSVELMMKTYLGLPKRVTGISLGRKQFDEISQSFPELLNAIEVHAADKLSGIDLAEIEWYHRLRNELYHQGNGLTVEMEKVRIYAELAKLLFENLFGIELEIKVGDEWLLAEFLKAWSMLEKVVHKFNASLHEQYAPIVGATAGEIAQKLADAGEMDKEVAQGILSLQQLRNSIVTHQGHSNARKIRAETVEQTITLTALVEASRPGRPHLIAEAELRDESTRVLMAALKGSKIRIFDLAKELGLDNKSVMEAARREGCDVAVPSNLLPSETAERIRAKLSTSKKGRR